MLRQRNRSNLVCSVKCVWVVWNLLHCIFAVVLIFASSKLLNILFLSSSPFCSVEEAKENEYSPEILEFLSHAKTNGIHSVSHHLLSSCGPEPPSAHTQNRHIHRRTHTHTQFIWKYGMWDWQMIWECPLGFWPAEGHIIKLLHYRTQW